MEMESGLEPSTKKQIFYKKYNKPANTLATHRFMQKKEISSIEKTKLKKKLFWLPIQYKLNLYMKLTGCFSLCLSVAKYLANHETDKILPYIETYHRSRQLFKLLCRRILQPQQKISNLENYV